MNSGHQLCPFGPLINTTSIFISYVQTLWPCGQAVAHVGPGRIAFTCDCPERKGPIEFTKFFVRECHIKSLYICPEATLCFAGWFAAVNITLAFHSSTARSSS